MVITGRLRPVACLEEGEVATLLSPMVSTNMLVSLSARELINHIPTSTSILILTGKTIRRAALIVAGGMTIEGLPVVQAVGGEDPEAIPGPRLNRLGVIINQPLV